MIENEVWNLAEKVFTDMTAGELQCAGLLPTGVNDRDSIFIRFTVQQVAESIQKYERSPKLQRGDELISTTSIVDFKAVVISADYSNNRFVFLNQRGEMCSGIISATDFERTGRHYAEIDILLGKMQGCDDKECARAPSLFDGD